MTAHAYNNPMIGLNTTLSVGTAPATSFAAAPTGATPVAWVKDFDSDFALEVVEWKNLSTQAKRRMPGIFDMGQPTFGISYLPGDASVSALWNLFINRTMVVWLVTFPDTSAVAFNGFISKMPPKVEDVSSEIQAQIEISIDGMAYVFPVAS